MEKRKMPRWEMALFAAGDLFGGGGQAMLSVLYLLYMTNVLRIDPAWAGAVLFVSKAWDAISDPLMGVLSDNTRTKLGRRRPYLIAGGFLIVAAMALVWLPVGSMSQVWKVVFVMVSYLFYNTVATVIAVPYSSMSTEVTADFAQCNRVNLLRLVFSLTATALCTLLPMELYKAYQAGTLPLRSFYLTLVFGFGTAFALPLILAGCLVKERVPYEDRRSAFSAATFVKPLRVRAFRRLLILYICQAVTLDIVSAEVGYYAYYVVPGMDPTVFLGAFLGVQLLAFPVLNAVVNKVSKTKIYRFGLPLSIVGSLCIAFYPAGFPAMGVYALTFLTALGFAGAQTMCWIIFPDVVDIGELGLGERNIGSFSGVMTFVRKSSYALASLMMGIAMSAAGFVVPPETGALPAQPAAVVTSFRLFMFLPFLFLMGYAWFAAKKFRLTPEVSQSVKRLNQRLRAAGPEGLEEGERAKYEALKKEFVS